MNTKHKGSVAEQRIAADLLGRGYQVAKPLADTGDWDLLVERPMGPTAELKIQRIQVKYSKSDGNIIKVRARCHSVMAGKVAKTVVYRPDSFEWIAIYDPTSDGCYYLPSSLLTGAGELYLRLTKPLKSSPNIRWAKDFQQI
jgi:hypothetical protein